MNVFINNTPVSVNHAYRAYRGRVVLSAKAREFKQHVLDCLPEDYIKIMGKVRLEVKFMFKDKRKRDIDNYLKVLLDSIKGVLFEDDDQIYELKVVKAIGCEREGIELRLEGWDMRQAGRLTDAAAADSNPSPKSLFRKSGIPANSVP